MKSVNETNKGGAPAGNKNRQIGIVKRDKFLQIRVSEQEREDIKRRAKKEGQNASQFILECIKEHR